MSNPKLGAVPTGSGVNPCCCDPGCCPYPAAEMDGLFSASDLPAAVSVTSAIYTGVMSKSGSGYADGSVTLTVISGSWQLSDGSTTVNIGACLITGDGNFTPGDDTAEDQWPDTLTVTEPASFFSQTLPRMNLCSWYIGFGALAVSWNKLTCKWVLNLYYMAYPEKTGDQDGPQGTYINGAQTYTVA